MKKKKILHKTSAKNLIKKNIRRASLKNTVRLDIAISADLDKFLKKEAFRLRISRVKLIHDILEKYL
ncbi:hypothetical protein A2997_02400 [Candidatus Nomurabacteria bacterium RIFCSPLOWO2_01_FULL_36_10b]|uniref:Ribbon-helix-helix protein CopG domain-containing protein n=1 Tax=Candidatus Nomurabacteria bacterium RIFCSPLOWO2_01_FULL_36_10b TaxID=1801766 RepID=A0A1F6WP26_9BACT|nr:MAG: hypothetical protein A2997_02400 [Candidatus Nomurabacteria bacterium RIFCSPLOWO2_01_FULL_36_10b]